MVPHAYLHNMIRLGLRLLAILFVQSALITLIITRPQLLRYLSRGHNKNPAFSWDTLEPRHDLHWQSCFPDRQCARLIVPLDHAKPDNGKEATIALIRKPSRFPRNSPRYRGPILFNPGGPGGSGVDLIQSRGDQFSVIVGPHFDVVGFDPRGIGHSTPLASFFQTPVERELFREPSILANYSVEGVARAWARAHVLGRLAERNDDGGGLRYLDTEQTAYDMLSIMHAYGENKLQYWGMSYGTVLGAVFASLFPDKVGRLIIDGVVDADEYFGNKWSNNLSDSPQVLDFFFTSCSSAGPSDCAFWAPTPADVRKNLTTLYATLHTAPMPAFALSMSDTTYGLLDYSSLHYAIFRALYAPIASFAPLASGLAALAAGDPNPLFALHSQKPFTCDSSTETQTSNDAATAIFCNDNLPLPGELSWTEGYFDMMAQASPFGDIWAKNLIECQKWPRFPKNNFRGPFEGNTSHPILLIGNTADPVTPLWGAYKMAKGFLNSVVLTQDSPGHCSLSAASICTAHHIRDYFHTGALPEPGTICNATSRPFSQSLGFNKDDVQRVMSTSSGDYELLTALTELSKEQIISTR